jgi:hypothetical protein
MAKESFTTDSNKVKSVGGLNARSNKDLEIIEKERVEALEPEENKTEENLSMLAAALHKLWGEAKLAKLPVEERLAACNRMLEGEYGASKLTAIKTIGGSEAYIRLGARKKRDAYSWIMDILKPSGDRIWTLEATPLPELPPEEESEIALEVVEGLKNQVIAMANAQGVIPPSPEEFEVMVEEVVGDGSEEISKALSEEADKRMEKMALKIEDQMVEGGWFKTFKEVVDDITGYPAGIMKAPVLRNIPTEVWGQDPESGKWESSVAEKVTPNFDRVSPWDFYPEGDADTVNGGFCFERHRMTRKDLNALLGVPGYKDEAIRKVLREYGDGGLREWLWTDTERIRLKDSSWNILRSKRIDALEFWGSIQGKHLLDFGLTEEQVPDEDLDYEINAWVIGNEIIKAVLSPDKLGKKPYFPTSFEKIPGQIWGKGVPEVLEDLQQVYNSSARALANNIAIASGPQVEVDTDRVGIGADIKNIVPWKVWPSTNQMMSNSPAVRFYQPPLHAQQLIAVMEKWERLADSDSGIPSYAHGDPRVGGAGNTASGLSMMMTAAARGIKNVIQNIDLDQISPVVEQMYNHNMRYDPDDRIKGDAKVKAGGSHSVIAQEQLAMRRKDLLAATANDIDMAIMGLEGRKKQLEEAFKSVEMDPSKMMMGDTSGPPIQQQGPPAGENAQLPGGVGDQGGRSENIVSE